MIEEWRQIPGFEDAYEVSSLGSVRNSRGRILKSWLQSKGYEQVHLFGKNVSVHRLVATAFLGSPNDAEQVNHKDGVKTNNAVGNLEWCTAQENVRHAKVSGLCVRKVSSETADSMWGGYASGKTTNEIATMHGVHRTTVRRVIKTHGLHTPEAENGL